MWKKRIVLPFETSSRWPFIRANCWKSPLMFQTRAVVSPLAVASFLLLLSNARSKTSSSCPDNVARQELVLTSHIFALLSIEDVATSEQSKLYKQFDSSARWPINTLDRLILSIKSSFI